MKAVIISRVSTEEQKDKGNSLPAQESRLRDYCKRKHLEVVKSFSFDESAYKATRIEFDEILNYIAESKFQLAICFDKVDRLSRNIFDKRVALLYEKALADEIELHFTSDGQTINSSISAVEKFQFGMSLGLSKYYSDAISDNVKRAFNQKLSQGEWIGKAPIGYLNQISRNKKQVTLDPKRAPLIAKMFELYSTGNYSVKTLQIEITRLGLDSTEGYGLSGSMIYKTLKEKFYMGIMTSKGVEYPHKYPPIVSRSLYHQVQEVRKSFNKKKVKYAAKPFVFRGIITCEKCGGTITGEIAKGKYIYYSCYNPKRICERIYIREEKFLEVVGDTLRRLRLPQDKLDAIAEAVSSEAQTTNDFRQKVINKLEADLREVETRSDRLMDALIDGKLSEETYKARNEKNEKQKLDLQVKLEEYQGVDEEDLITAKEILDVASRAYEIFLSSDIKEKRQLLNMIYQNCRLSGKNPLFELRTPFDSIIECADQPTVLPLVNKLRTFDWESITCLEIKQRHSR